MSRTCTRCKKRKRSSQYTPYCDTCRRAVRLKAKRDWWRANSHKIR